MYSKYEWGDGLDIDDDTYSNYTIEEAENHLTRIRQHMKYCARDSKSENDEAHQWYMMTLELHRDYDIAHRMAHPDSYIRITYPQMDDYVSGKMNKREVELLYTRIIKLLDHDFYLMWIAESDVHAAETLFQTFADNLHQYGEELASEYTNLFYPGIMQYEKQVSEIRAAQEATTRDIQDSA